MLLGNLDIPLALYVVILKTALYNSFTFPFFWPFFSNLVSCVTMLLCGLHLFVWYVLHVLVVFTSNVKSVNMEKEINCVGASNFLLDVCIVLYHESK